MDNHDETPKPIAPGEPHPGEVYGVLAEFESPGALVKAARKVHEAGYTQFDAYSPFPVHGIDDAMGIKRTILPLLVFGGGFAGLLGGILLQWYLNSYNWPFSVSGKPVWSLPANIPIAFETTILLSVLTTFFGMWILNKLPQVWHPLFRLDRFTKVTDDGFMIGIEAKDPRFDLQATTKLLKDAGALEIETAHLDPDPASKQMPKWIFGLILASTVIALIPFAVIAKARASKSTEPHYHIFSDMDFQEKVKSDTAFDLFPDGRANRGEITGTVARGELRAEDDLYRGLRSPDPSDPRSCLERRAAGLPCEFITGFPAGVEPTRALAERGQDRFNIYCAPCHGYDGRGTGAIARRAQQIQQVMSPANLVQPGGTAVQMPNGQLFNTISNGMNTMAGYSAQIPVHDRWAIVLYVRALERAQNAQLADDPEFLQNAK